MFTGFLCLLLATGAANAQGNLLLMPRRVVFEGPKRYEELNLANTGQDTARYLISLMHIRMKEDGGFEEIAQPDSGANFADRFVRFFPHSVELGPGESQVVKIQLTNIRQMSPGEYRSHIYFRAIPNEAPAGDTTATQDSGLSIRLIPIFGISIPVIIRVGESNTHVTISDLSLQQSEGGIPRLSASMHRSGNMSAYGDISVVYTPENGKPILAGSVKGIAIYTPLPVRRFRIDLDNKKDINYHSGKLTVVYSTPEEKHPVTIAEAALTLH